MKVIKTGTVVQFSCGSCDCVFVVGIHATITDNEENHYCCCPVCGAECHANVNDVNKSCEGR